MRSISRRASAWRSLWRPACSRTSAIRAARASRVRSSSPSPSRRGPACAIGVPATGRRAAMRAEARSRSRWAIWLRRVRLAARSSTSCLTGVCNMKYLLAEQPMYHRALCSDRLYGAQRSHGHGWPVHRPPARYGARALRGRARPRDALAAAGRPRDRGLRARRRDAGVPDVVGPAAGRLAVGRLAGQLPRRLGHARHRGRLRGDDRLADADARAGGPARFHLAGRKARGRHRPARGCAATHLRDHGDRRRARLRLLVPDPRGTRAVAGAAVRRLFERYRQFQALPPDAVSRELRERRDEQRAREVVFVPELDLSRTAWHEPPHPEAVNAATFALRRRMNAYPDPAATQVRELAAARHGVRPDQVAVGHGAAELLQDACAQLIHAGELLVAWPGWRPLPDLAQRAGGTPVAVPGQGGIGPLAERAGADTRAVALSSPNDPTGAPVARADV